MHHNLEYNTQKVQLIIPEYGRNVQNLIEYAKTIEDDVERQHFAEAIVDLMFQMVPNNKNNPEYKDKLWRHFFRIANFEINVTPPNGEVPTPESVSLKPERLEYPDKDKDYKHYGNHVKRMINKALAMEDKEKQQEFAETIGAYMKLAYRTWSKEHFVSDETVKADLKKLSKGVLIVNEETALDSLSSKLRKRPSNSNSNQNNRGRRQPKGGPRRRRR